MHKVKDNIMKMKICILVIGLVVLYPVSVSGQHLSTMDLIVNGGISIPTDPKSWSENWKWGLTGGVGISYRLSQSFSIETHIDYYSFFFDDWSFSARLPFTNNIRNIDAKNSSIIGLSALMHYGLLPHSPTFSPYFSAGLGFQRYYVSDIRIFEQTWEGEFVSDEIIPGETSYGIFLIAGGGVSLVASDNRSYFIEVHYGIGFSGDDPNHFLPIRIGFRHRIK